MAIKSDIAKYYREIDFSIWNKSINICFDQLKKLKTEKTKNPWALKMYANYLQLIEIFCITVWVTSEGELYENLFIRNTDLRKKIGDTFLNKKIRNAQEMDFLIYFLESWVFGIQKKSSINNLDQKRRIYVSMLHEIMNDYLKDYDLLNAYKHGFRTKSRGMSSVSIQGRNSSAWLIGSYNTKIIYLSKKRKTIYECSISFNWERVSQKCSFLFNMLENTQKILIADGRETTLEILYPLDSVEFNKHSGAFRVNTPLSN